MRSTLDLAPRLRASGSPGKLPHRTTAPAFVSAMQKVPPADSSCAPPPSWSAYALQRFLRGERAIDSVPCCAMDGAYLENWAVHTGGLRFPAPVIAQLPAEAASKGEDSPAFAGQGAVEPGGCQVTHHLTIQPCICRLMICWP